MKILIVTQYFYPENFKCNDMAFELRRRGHEVTVMTAIPNYPKGHFFDGYGIFKKRKEILNGVKVHRSLLIPRGNSGSIRLALNYISYTVFSSLKALWFGLTKNFDSIIVHEPSPILVGIPAVIVKKFQNIPIHFWVLDLWPESLSAAGGIKNESILGFFDQITKWIYRNSNTLLVGSKGYRQSIIKKGDFDKKIKYFPNWVEESLLENKSLVIPDFPLGFNIVVAGNMGEAQDLPHVLDAILLLKGKPINIIFIGDGRKKEYVDKFAIENGLQKQIHCLGRYPLDYMPSFFEKADILFMALKDKPIFTLTVPSRIQAYMSAGKPIVAMINGEGANLIAEADCGWAVPAEDSKTLASLFEYLSNLDSQSLYLKGMNGKKFSETHFNFKKCIDHLEQIIIETNNIQK